MAKNIVISGATGGIGSAIAKKFAIKQYDIILLGRDILKLEKLSESIRKDHKVKVKYYHCDISITDSIVNSIESVINTVDSIELLVNATGVFPIAPIIKMRERVYEECMDVNVRLPYLLSIGLFDCLRSQRGGKVINIGSSSSYKGFKNTVLYCTSKHAILGFSRALNDEWKDLGVTVHCVSPGTVDTNMVNSLNQDSSTYISVKEFADLVYDVNKYNGNMLISEVRVSRKFFR
jgi:short-subunit dehydrogenase